MKDKYNEDTKHKINKLIEENGSIFMYKYFDHFHYLYYYK